MTGATHVVLALGTLGVQRYCTGLDLSPVGLAMIVVGALAPDLDGQGLIARPGRLCRRWIGRRWATLLNVPFLALSGWVRASFGHRGLLHTPFFAACLALLGAGMNLEWLIFFSWGYVTHLVGDLCTVAGIPVLGPYSWARYRILSVKTGSRGEIVVASILILVCILWAGGVLRIGSV
jgi:membrane-bound metal-dependent hydrolase YbcI (DUF457 family)